MQIVFRPYDDPAHVATIDAARGNLAGQKRLRAVWQDFFGVRGYEEGADFENFFESAALLDAALRIGLPVVAVKGREPEIVAATKDARPIDESPFVALGRIGDSDPLLDHPRLAAPSRASVRRARHYWHLGAFLDAAGRPVRTASFPEDGLFASENAVGAVVERFAEEGVRDLFLKLTPAKYGTRRLVLPADAGRKEISEALFGALEYSVVHLEGLDEACLVQPFLEMGNEYRILVVGHRPVAGAGCIECMTPLANDGPFDAKLERRRGDGTIVHDAELVARYLARARKIAAAIAAEDETLSSYVLDLATLANGAIAVVEINPPIRFGLYALDTRLLLRAMIEEARRTPLAEEGSGLDVESAYEALEPLEEI